jgi:hypothetical protein
MKYRRRLPGSGLKLGRFYAGVHTERPENQKNKGLTSPGIPNGLSLRDKSLHIFVSCRSTSLRLSLY